MKNRNHTSARKCSDRSLATTRLNETGRSLMEHICGAVVSVDAVDQEDRAG